MRHLQLFIPWLFAITLFALQVTPVQANPIKVEVTQAELADLGVGLELTGTVTAFNNAQLASQQSGVVAQILVEAGDKVSQGQLLLSLDDTLAKLQLAQAKAEQNIAEVALQEAKRLHKELLALSKRQLVAQTLLAERQADIAKAKAQLKNANAKLALQQELLNRHHIKAPFDGVITARSVDVGEWIGTQNQVFSLVSHNKLRLELAAPQQYYRQLMGAQTIKARIVVGEQQVINSQVERLVASVDSNSRTFKVFVNVPSEAQLLVGSSAKARIDMPAQQQDTVWLPRSSVKRHPDGGHSVFAVVDNKAKRIFVEVIEQTSERIAVKGAPSHYDYIKAGVELLKDGAFLTVSKGSAL